AEAEAKLGQTAQALADVDLIRKNRGLQNALYNGSVPANQTVLQAVLQERRLELAFEGHRMYDVYRNKLNLNRTYWGYHLPGLKESDINLNVTPTGYANMIIPYTSPKIIYYLPVEEVLSNPLATQNP
ncbi:MAG: RagB/SusD family nutrient uptake outer membrane protein, partial [Sphingobacteriaceae bacterium]